MSLYDDASLVMIPSGYKDGKVYSIKPTNGDGDLTFTRSNDTATRVGPDGLIEKVRTNTYLYSNTFTDAAWAKVGGVTMTGGQADPDGGTNAFLYERTLAFDYVAQSLASGSYTISIYAKANASNFLRIAGSLGGDVVFNLATGVVSSASSATGAIQSLGNGWYRCSVYIPTATTTHFIQNFPVDNGTLGAGSVYIYKAQAELNDIATDYIPTTTAAASVGPVANLPRLDYLDSSCPKLLLEPQRTNLNIYSEDITNATWDKLDLVTTNYANVVVSPDGYTNADKLIPNTTSAQYHGLQLGSGRPSLTGGTIYTYSIFAKAEGYDKIRIQNFSQAIRAQFNLTTGALINESGTTSTFITPYENGWYRIGFTYTQSTTQSSYWNVLVVSTDDNSGVAPIAWAGNGTDAIAVWGSTIEEGAYATSYIPTLSAASTRGVESALNFSALVNNTAFTLFFEGSYSFPDSNFWDLLIGVNQYSGNYFGFYSGFIAIYNVGSGTQTIGPALAPNTVHKLLIKYDGTTAKYYRNGSLFLSIPATGLGTFGDGYIYNNDQEGLKVNQLLYFPTALTDAEAIALTTL